ncbi:hypothetical protein JKF63_06309 [Porcisia hertigi]|uniref:Thiamine diphosphokinase n=1 Tax=Porcisia hertigi TaxID=2761500 RepID=A0A836IHG3_9TRYP|nr:hypothetical protein JKF63_06309 [Porcisia hertigi]
MSQTESCPHPRTQPALYTRKLCSCNALLAVDGSDAASTDAPVPDTSLFGVILLNSPANTDEDFASYIRLFERHRGRVFEGVAAGKAEVAGEEEAAPAPVSGRHTPYFICADGAYAALARYLAKRCPGVVGSGSDGKNAVQSAPMALRLFDALIGDMDSLSARQLMRFAPTGGANAASTSAAGGELPNERGDVQGNCGSDERSLFYDRVDTIPAELVEAIRRRRDAYTCGESSATSPVPVEPPVVLPVACQMTTDFGKCVALLLRLWALDAGLPDTPTGVNHLQGLDQEVPLAEQSHEATALAAEYVARLPETSSTAAVQAGEDEREAGRCRRLLESVTPSAPSTTEQPPRRLETRVLPNVAVFGALGGRVDHEMGAICCLLRYARVFHIMVVNKYNILFACWPDGVTQVVLPRSWSPPGAAVAPYMCGIVPFGSLREAETAGFLWNMVKGRPEVYDGYTQTNGYRLAFDGIVSVCNTVTSPVVTIDVRPLHCALEPRVRGSAAPMRCVCDPGAPSVNPPVLFTLGLPETISEPHADECVCL